MNLKEMVELLERHYGTQRGVAAALHVPEKTYSDWRKRTYKRKSTLRAIEARLSEHIRLLAVDRKIAGNK